MRTILSMLFVLVFGLFTIVVGGGFVVGLLLSKPSAVEPIKVEINWSDKDRKEQSLIQAQMKPGDVVNAWWPQDGVTTFSGHHADGKVFHGILVHKTGKATLVEP